MISFREGFSEFRVAPFPRLSVSAVPIVAPLWGDYNFRRGGSVVYRLASDNATLERARDLIVERNPRFSDFSPGLCVIVTWVDAVLLTRAFEGRKVPSMLL